MTSSLVPLAIALGGALAGWLLARVLAHRGEVAAARERAAAEALARLRVETLQEDIARLEREKLESGKKLEALHAERDEARETRAALREKADAIPELARRLAEAEAALARAGERAATLAAELEQERRGASEKAELLARAEERLKEAFEALSTQALVQNGQTFLEQARVEFGRLRMDARDDLDARRKAIDDLLGPVRATLEKMDGTLRQVDQGRVGSEAGLRQLLASVQEAQSALRAETQNLVKALRAPTVRGRWGEIQLRRVVEVAGMLAYCDFEEQVSKDVEGGRLRPDLVVRLPGGKTVVVDAKAPLLAYLDALEAPDETTREARLRDHARQVRDHVGKLASKAYWEQFQPAPEFVVLFLPGETFFSAALSADPGLLEAGAAERVIPASPTTLIALLKAVAYGWRQERIAASAEAMSALGRELYDRVGSLASHLSRLGKALDGAVAAYNGAVGAVESRVLVSARRFRDLGATAGAELEPLPPVEKSARPLTSPELRALPDGDDR